MSPKFPDLPMFHGINAPSRIELDLHDLEVDGEIPRELDGAFYRVAPDHQYPPRFLDDVPFNADGAISRFLFERGRVHLRHRYVRTERFALERTAGRALYGKYRNPFTDDPSVAGKSRNLANTTPLVWDGKLLALREDSPPIALDPLTLETQGDWSFHGTLNAPTFTAHPKIDPRTGQMIAFGYAAKGLFSREVAYYEVSTSGRIEHEVWFEAPYHCMLHDFAVTQDYAVFPIIPLCGVGIEALQAGRPHYAWDSSKDVHLGVLPRGGAARELRWFRAPNQFCSHVMNAFNEGTRVHIDVPLAEGNMFPFFPEPGTPWDPRKAQSRLTRWTVDMSSPGEGFHSTERLTHYVGEFPKTDHRYQTQPYRHGWLLGFDPTRSSIAHVDHATGKTSSWSAGEDTALQEPCFIPRSDAAQEGDGYIVTVATRIKEMRTDVFLLEARRLEAGPIATLHLPLRLRPGYHGSWAPRAALAP
ncbi:MAG TPA: carotenoid oxygenase family protein [Steroidobacteraceae bacterium]|nr:carotenoid oxygenase family protein [Steroidobacteraceae bacterium]